MGGGGGGGRKKENRGFGGDCRGGSEGTCPASPIVIRPVRERGTVEKKKSATPSTKVRKN